MIAGVAAGILGRRWGLRWGATDEEVEDTLPGDELIAQPQLVATRAITVHRPAEEVWPWIAQLGQGRAGFYSYEALENLFGCDIHNADEIVAEWQGVKAGDEVRLAPNVGLEVARAEPPRALVLRGAAGLVDEPPPYDFTWAFVLNASEEGCRLVVRERYGYLAPWAPLMVEPVQVVSFLMTQRMLRGIRDRAESGRLASGDDLAA